MTVLRERMIGDMQIRNFTEKTQKLYVDAVSKFAKHFWKSPAELGPEHVRAYLLYLAHRKSESNVRTASAALRFCIAPAIGTNSI